MASKVDNVNEGLPSEIITKHHKYNYMQLYTSPELTGVSVICIWFWFKMDTPFYWLNIKASAFTEYSPVQMSAATSTPVIQ